MTLRLSPQVDLVFGHRKVAVQETMVTHIACKAFPNYLLARLTLLYGARQPLELRVVMWSRLLLLHPGIMEIRLDAFSRLRAAIPLTIKTKALGSILEYFLLQYLAFCAFFEHTDNVFF